MTQEVRPLEESEYIAYFNMAAQAFRAPAARARRNMEMTPASELRGLFENKELIAGLKLIDLPIWIGGTKIEHRGITGVASPPEYRRQGYMNKLLFGTLEELRATDVPLTSLYPFYFPFYKRFGWEHIEDKYLYKIPIDRIPAGKIEGRWEALSRSTDFDKEGGTPVSDEGLAVLMDIYDRWCVGKSGPLARDAKFWRRGPLQHGAENRPDVYVWYNPDGRPSAYVIYSFEDIPNEWKRNMIVWGVMALDHQALSAALTFMRNHDSQAISVYVNFPADLPVLALLDNPEFTIEVHAGLMLRLTDVPQALQARSYPPDVEDGLNIAVIDSFVPWNNGTFFLSVEDGKGQSGPSDAAPGLSMDQKTLARIYSGYFTAERAVSMGLVEVHDAGALKAAQKIFAGPVPYAPDHF